MSGEQLCRSSAERASGTGEWPNSVDEGAAESVESAARAFGFFLVFGAAVAVLLMLALWILGCFPGA